MPKNVFAGIGISKADDAYQAGKEAVEKAISNMQRQGGKKPTFGLVFCSGSKYGKDDRTIQRLADGVHSVFGNVQWAGCTTAGEISPLGSTKGAVVVMVLGGEYLRFGIGIGKDIGKNPRKAGEDATREAFNSLQLDVHVDGYLQYMRVKKHKPSEIIKMIPYSIILLGKGGEKGLVPNVPKIYDMEEVVNGIIDTCGAPIPIVGGGAFDDWQLKKNYHIVNGKAYGDIIVVILMLSNLYFSTGLDHGYKPTGKVALINKSRKMFGACVVSRINNKKALDAYAELSGFSKDEIKKDPMRMGALHPLGIVDPAGESWVKVFGDVFMDNLLFGSSIKENVAFQLMDASEKEIFNAYKEAVEKSLKQIGKKKPAAVLVFSCCCRNRFLGKKIGKEVEVFKKYFPNVPFAGFYTFYEFGGTLGNRMGVHMQSVMVLVITDELMV